MKARNRNGLIFIGLFCAGMIYITLPGAPKEETLESIQSDRWGGLGYTMKFARKCRPYNIAPTQPNLRPHYDQAAIDAGWEYQKTLNPGNLKPDWWVTACKDLKSKIAQRRQESDQRQERRAQRKQEKERQRELNNQYSWSDHCTGEWPNKTCTVTHKRGGKTTSVRTCRYYKDGLDCTKGILLKITTTDKEFTK